jgi:hypothetical protein
LKAAARHGTNTLVKPRPKAPRPLADLIGQAIEPALAAQGFANREVFGLWAEIVGERLAARSRPVRIDWPRRRNEREAARPEPATLVVLVESAFAPEAQHAAPVIMARINGHLGWPAVGRVALKQGPVATASPAAPKARTALSGEQAAQIAAAADGVAVDAVREAVTRLGAAVLGRSRHGA